MTGLWIGDHRGPAAEDLWRKWDLPGTQWSEFPRVINQENSCGGLARQKAGVKGHSSSPHHVPAGFLLLPGLQLLLTFRFGDNGFN